jgi:hypothetical protein
MFVFASSAFSFIVLAALFLLFAVLYLYSLEKALARCDEHSLTTSPESVWLMLIPVFNLVYQFFLVGHVATSLGNEFVRRGISSDDRDHGKALGVAMCVLNVVTFACSRSESGAPPLFLAALVCWIVYWRKIARYSAMLAPGVSESRNLGEV